MSSFVLLHGWNNGDGGEHALGPLRDALLVRGHKVLMPSYGRVVTPWGTKIKSRETAQILSTCVRSGDTLIGHSNGGRIALEITHHTHKVRRVMLLNPALDRNMVPGSDVERCIVVHAPRDRAVWLAKFVPGSVWGDMGRVGYKPSKGWPYGADTRMENVSRPGGHSDYRVNPKRWAIMAEALAK